jgi:hypothetical protein
MLNFVGTVQAFLPYIERIELGPLEPVGEPGDGSIPYQRVLRITTAGCTFEVMLMAEKRKILTFGDESWLTPKKYQSDDEETDEEPED